MLPDAGLIDAQGAFWVVATQAISPWATLVTMSVPGEGRAPPILYVNERLPERPICGGSATANGAKHKPAHRTIASRTPFAPKHPIEKRYIRFYPNEAERKAERPRN